MLSFILILALALTSENDELKLMRIDDYAGQAKAYSDWAGLEPLVDSRGGPEIRVWTSTSLLGFARGWVVTRNRIRVYSNVEIVNGAQQESDTLRLVSTRLASNRSILNLFSTFSSVNGSGIFCPVYDGVGYTVEGKVSGEYFVFHAGNPGLCRVAHAQDIARAIEALREAAGEAR